MKKRKPTTLPKIDLEGILKSFGYTVKHLEEYNGMKRMRASRGDDVSISISYFDWQRIIWHINAFSPCDNYIACTVMNESTQLSVRKDKLYDYLLKFDSLLKQTMSWN